MYLYTSLCVPLVYTHVRTCKPVHTHSCMLCIHTCTRLYNQTCRNMYRVNTDFVCITIMCYNRYAAQCLEGTSKVWTTDDNEIKAYFGFYILMGIVREPEIRDYWSTNPFLHYGPIANKISRKRFEEISKYLHFVDNTNLPARGTPGYHRLQRVKPIVDMLRQRLSAVYSPGENISVDEAMIPFKG